MHNRECERHTVLMLFSNAPYIAGDEQRPMLDTQ